MYCKFCGDVDDIYDENSEAIHERSIKHLCNVKLYEYKDNKRHFSKNRDGVYINCDAMVINPDGSYTIKEKDTDHYKVRIYVKPNVRVKFLFHIRSDMKNEDLLVVGIQPGHPQPQYEMSNHPYVFGEKQHILEKKSSLPQGKNEVSFIFNSADIGQYEMPVMFTFHRRSTNRDLIFIREMVVMVEESPIDNKFTKSPYMNKEWEKADHFIRSSSDQASADLLLLASATGDFDAASRSFALEETRRSIKTIAKSPVADAKSSKSAEALREFYRPIHDMFKIPKLLKLLLPRGLDERALEGLPREIQEELRIVLIATRAIFDTGLTEENYMACFHHLLWWEEIVARINLRKYNMTGVTLLKKASVYLLEVPGLAEKRPSLMRGDRVYLRSNENKKVIYEGVIENIEENLIHIGGLDESFHANCSPECVWAVHFLLSRVPFERCHEAVSRLHSSNHLPRVFPRPRNHKAPLLKINKFFNNLIKSNMEQRSAVEHIVSGTSGKAPYIVFGPPGTGKTLTIVEAIVQLVHRNPRNRILVCADSNMAADHIALMLLKYNKVLNINKYLLRANAQTREWSVLPPELAPVSNGTSYESFVPLDNAHVAMYRVVVTTLLHAAKYASGRSQWRHRLQMSHVFIDEAAQASEPKALVPVCGLLAGAGQLVLAGDTRQLKPVCMSRNAAKYGLGTSLMERLLLSYANLYENNPDYMTLLVNNFRSDPEILKIPNELFYENKLKALAPRDPLSAVSVLGLAGGARAVVFHAVNSREQRMGKAPSYYNEKELEMLKRYVTQLINVHNVQTEDIGVIAPYIRQVYKVKAWLKEQHYDKIEVGTVEAFQGKEKRVILVTTVRANCRLLEYDAKYGLGFLVDDERYNVALTRAKAKIIIIGNPACLVKDVKWRLYMELCEEYDTYHGKEHQQLERTAVLLHDVAGTRFDRCRLTQAMKELKIKQKENTT